MDDYSNDQQVPQADSLNSPYKKQPSPRSKRPLLIAALVLLMMAVGIGGFFAGKYLTDKESVVKNDVVRGKLPETKWTKLVSNKKGFPVSKFDSKVLTYYSIEKAKLITLDKIKTTMSGTGRLGQGTSTALASPDLHYIAYIGDDSNLYLFSNETEQTQQLTTNGFVSFITGWSPDSKKVLYYFERRTIGDSMAVIDAPSPTSITFKPQYEQGFFQTDIETGEVKPLAAVEHVEGYVDKDTLLVKPSYESSLLATFNLNSFVADLSRIDVKAGFGVAQFDFSSDGKLWAYSAAESKDEPTKGEVPIVFGDFPNAATTIVDTGKWADVQSPKFSPDNTKIAYQKRFGTLSGIPQYHVLVYDIATGQKTDVGDGDTERWIDGKTLLVGVRDNPTDPHTKRALMNIETKAVTRIE